tara:strand:+ start:138 stop:551 length:414 start_codon:yes stop_codon:yes gene_type:complete
MTLTRDDLEDFVDTQERIHRAYGLASVMMRQLIYAQRLPAELNPWPKDAVLVAFDDGNIDGSFLFDNDGNEVWVPWEVLVDETQQTFVDRIFQNIKMEHEDRQKANHINTKAELEKRRAQLMEEINAINEDIEKLGG